MQMVKLCPEYCSRSRGRYIRLCTCIHIYTETLISVFLLADSRVPCYVNKLEEKYNLSQYGKKNKIPVYAAHISQAYTCMYILIYIHAYTYYYYYYARVCTQRTCNEFRENAFRSVLCWVRHGIGIKTKTRFEYAYILYFSKRICFLFSLVFCLFEILLNFWTTQTQHKYDDGELIINSRNNLDNITMKYMQ